MVYQNTGQRGCCPLDDEDWLLLAVGPKAVVGNPLQISRRFRGAPWTVLIYIRMDGDLLACVPTKLRTEIQIDNVRQWN